MSDVTPQNIAWCQTTFMLLAEGGVWGVPRNGLVFTKRNGRLELTERMPFTPELAEAAGAGKDVPKTAGELRAYQDAELEETRKQFGAAGIEVVDAI